MDKETKLELLMIISRFEGFLMGLTVGDMKAGVNSEYIHTQLDNAVVLLQKENSPLDSVDYTITAGVV